MKRLMSSVAPLAIISATHQFATMMAVATRYGTAFPDPSVKIYDPVPFHKKGGEVQCLRSKITVDTTDDNGSKYYLGKVWSSARPLLGISTIKADATGLTGIADSDIGDATDPDGLADGIDLSAANASKNPFAAVTVAEGNDALWTILGYTEDPNRELDLYLTIKDDADATCVLLLEMYFTMPF